MESLLKRFLLGTWLGRFALIPVRFNSAMRYYAKPIGQLLLWSLRSRELANFTYPLMPHNIDYLAHTIAAITGIRFAEAKFYLLEVENDQELKAHIRNGIQASRYRHSTDSAELGRRIGWYALARILKPEVVVETGVDKGHGAVTLCAALLRNCEEGHNGCYYGTDINPDAGFLLAGKYASVGRILYGDSLESLKLIDHIDLFINDSDHSAEYEAREYEAILPKLGPRGVILGDNSHVTSKLADFSERHERSFVFFKEQPRDHWYPGAGIGISFPASQRMR